MSKLIKADYVQVGNAFTLDLAKMTPPRKMQTNKDAPSDAPENNLSQAEQKIAQMLAEAKSQADALVAEGQRQADALLAQSEEQAQAARAQAEAQGYEAGKAKGYEDGYAAGFAEGENKAYQDNHGAALALQQALDDYEKQWQSLLEENIDDLKYLALEIAEKIVDKQIIMDPDFYIRMVDKALESFRSYQWVDIHIGEQPVLAVRLEKHLADIMSANSAYLRIRQEKDVPPGYLMVESDAGVVDASIATQLTQAKGLLTVGGAEAN